MSLRHLLQIRIQHLQQDLLGMKEHPTLLKDWILKLRRFLNQPTSFRPGRFLLQFCVNRDISIPYSPHGFAMIEAVDPLKRGWLPYRTQLARQGITVALLREIGGMPHVDDCLIESQQARDEIQIGQHRLAECRGSLLHLTCPIERERPTQKMPG